MSFVHKKTGDVSKFDLSQNSLGPTLYPGTVPVGENEFTDWRRNPSWPACDVSVGDETMKVLIAVYPEGTNYEWFAPTFSNAGANGTGTIDWGDSSTPQSVNSGVSTGHNYSYTDSALNGTDGPVTFTASTSTVNRNNHGHINGDFIRFYNLQTTTGITEDAIYYVINATTNTFQVSTTLGGSAVTLTNDGSATLLPYKIATCVIQADTGQWLTGINFGTFPTSSPLPPWASGTTYSSPYRYARGILDIAIAGERFAVLLNMGSSSQNAPIQYKSLERVRLIEGTDQTTGCNLYSAFQNLTSLKEIYISPDIYFTGSNLNFLCTGCYSLVKINWFDTSRCTSITNMFSLCIELKEIPAFDFNSATNMSSTFNGCRSVKNFPTIYAPNCSTWQSTFAGCHSMEYAPEVITNTANTKNTLSMFSGCTALKETPKWLNNWRPTNLNSTFSSCYMLKELPTFDTSSCTQFSGVCSTMYALEKFPEWDMSNGTNVGYAFQNCASLKYIPDVDFSSAPNLVSTFNACSGLQRIGKITTSSSLTSLNFTFFGCRALEEGPIFTNTSSVNNWQYTFGNCNALKRVPLYDLSGVGSYANPFRQMFASTYSLTSVGPLDFSGATGFDNANNTNTPFYQSAIENCEVTGIAYSISFYELNLSGAALDQIYTNLETVTGQTIVVTRCYGVGDDTPSIATAKGWTVTG